MSASVTIQFPLRAVTIYTRGRVQDRQARQREICAIYLRKAEASDRAYKMKRMRELGLTPTAIARKLGISRQTYYETMREFFGDVASIA